ncbi:sensor histidine kinase [Maribellus mangrovi]|uniref:sensor histidine kinase n=1 Tax=Maribellus mangrovi TaxID=3133146 RepID=UPI0030EC0CF2
MKQLLFFLIIFLFTSHSFQVQARNNYDETTWNTIRERLFDGTNSRAYRFTEDIRIKLDGNVTLEDSSIVKGIVIELSKLIETVEVKLVQTDANFVININNPENGFYTRMSFSPKNEITHIETTINKEDNYYQNEKHKFFQYTIITKLTKTFTPRYASTKYFGFFDTSSFEEAKRFTEIDQNLLQKLYSKNFYRDLKRNTVKKYGFLYYLNIRFEGWIKKFSIIITIVLIIILILLMLAYPSISTKNGLWNYSKRELIFLIGIAIIYWFYTLPNSIPFFQFAKGYYYFFANFVEVIIYGIPVLVLIYYTDRLLLNRINNFYQQQIFVFISTFLLIALSYWLISIPFAYLNSKSSGQTFNLLDHLVLTKLLDIAIIAILRVLYNIINYRIQSMVNQKDVEIAKMKELKNQAELNALHSRINPHFLYNSLNSIASLAHIDADKTENMATGLSELFRYSINKENKTFVTVAEELEMVKKYLEIEKTRFGDRLSFEISTDEGSMEKQIPKFMIQPLVENAIKHGLSKIKGTGKIRVQIEREEKDLSIAIFDNGPDFPEEPVSGYGLQNLYDKLDIIYQNKASINWENGDNKHVRITLKNQF